MTVRHHPESAVAGVLLVGWLASRLDWQLSPLIAARRRRSSAPPTARRQDVRLTLEPATDLQVRGLAGRDARDRVGPPLRARPRAGRPAGLLPQRQGRRAPLGGARRLARRGAGSSARASARRSCATRPTRPRSRPRARRRRLTRPRGAVSARRGPRGAERPGAAGDARPDRGRGRRGLRAHRGGRPAGASPRDARKQVARLTAAGLVAADGPRLVARVDAIRAALAELEPEEGDEAASPARVRALFRRGRIVEIPRAPELRASLLRHLAERFVGRRDLHASPRSTRSCGGPRRPRRAAAVPRRRGTARAHGRRRGVPAGGRPGRRAPGSTGRASPRSRADSRGAAADTARRRRPALGLTVGIADHEPASSATRASSPPACAARLSVGWMPLEPRQVAEMTPARRRQGGERRAARAPRAPAHRSPERADASAASSVARAGVKE